MTSRVLVTGGTSLIGAGVIRSLAERGDDVVSLQRGTTSTVSHVPDSVTCVSGDIRDPTAVERAMHGCDGVIHLAAKVGVVGEWEAYRSINVDGTANVIAAAKRQGASRLVHVSSPSVAHGGEALVGVGAEPAIVEHGRAWYPRSKAMGETVALDSVSNDFGVVIIRPHLVWGPGDTQLVGRIVERARAGRLTLVGGGAALVDTTYIDNAVDALVAALDACGPGATCSGRAYVIANGQPRPIRELILGICAAAGVDAAPRSIGLSVAKRLGSIVERAWPRIPLGLRDGQDEPPLTRFLAEQLGTAHWFDPRPAHQDLGWTPRVSIDEGLVRLAEWFDDERNSIRVEG